jgi:hypothetical protein
MRPFDITVLRSGTLNVNLTWAEAAVDLDLYLTDSGCSRLAGCAILARSLERSGTMETFSRQVQANDRLKIWADNLDRAPQAFTMRWSVE